MIHHFAIEPELVTDVYAFRVIVRELGYEYGRVLTDTFPNDWFEKASEAIRKIPNENERSLAIDYLKMLRTNDTKRGRVQVPFDSAESWLTNVQLASTSFKAGICTDDTDLPADCPSNITRVSDVVSTENPLWEVPREIRFEATVDGTMTVLVPLIRGHGRVVLLDPFLDPTRRGHQEVATSIIESTLRGGSVEFHCSLKRNRDVPMPYEAWRRKWHGVLVRAAAKAKVTVRVSRWVERGSASRLHNRAVLTNRGGIRLERGLHIKEGDTNQASILGKHGSSGCRTLFKEFTRKNVDETAFHDFSRVDIVEIKPT